MAKRGTKIAIAALASVGGAIVGSQLYLSYLGDREDHLGVTLYSEPHYRGARRTLTRANIAQSPCSLADTGLPRIGSVRVERITDAVRPAMLNVAAGWMWVQSSILSAVSRDFDEALEGGRRAANLLGSALDPETWRLDRELREDRLSWVRLWADRPTRSVPPLDKQADPGEQPWHDVLTDTPDLGAWGTRARYLQLGVRSA